MPSLEAAKHLATSSNSSPRVETGHDLKKVAIVGSGSAGIGALWALNRTHHDVYIYEAADRLGGHTNTVEFKHGRAKTMVDTGFIVLNTATYPNFISFLEAIGVPTDPTEMTFGVSRDKGDFEWAGMSLSAVFAQRKNLFSPRMWRMIFDLIRFNQYALDLLNTEDQAEEHVNGTNGHANGKGVDFQRCKQVESIGEYLQRKGYSDAFRDDYLIPMTAAVWSTSPDKCSLDFPAVTLVRFMWNHHLLSTVAERPHWLTLKHCAKSYIDAVMSGFPSNHVFLNTPVESVTTEKSGKVKLHLENGNSALYDHVILATHGDQAHALILPEAEVEEREILSGFQTSKNTAILHSDLSLMPKLRTAWSSWNYITESSSKSSNIDQVCLTYNMNILQHLPEETFGPVLVTLNPLHEPAAKHIQGRYTYSHPLYNAEAIRSQSLLPRIQNTRGISYCGAWTKYGFHEDGFSSGIKIAQDHLGAQLPFEFKDSTFSRGKRPVLGLADLVLRLWISFAQMLIYMLETMFGVDRRVTAGPQIKENGAVAKKKTI
ncbi:hypothetical protein BJ875DRAFT_92935 [Amylocarpus encephaloides]|uniref:Amine oxidase domain-containing protein n=1 Tax=Amylocarpus encephaloides TaxID=45428 RepID=A0A9P7YE55_9HELO|nr:hypothetical protein BJ875DRAFT_92935 [Amylocarpus encephaloides]